MIQYPKKKKNQTFRRESLAVDEFIISCLSIRCLFFCRPKKMVTTPVKIFMGEFVLLLSTKAFMETGVALLHTSVQIKTEKS
ncbi:hypothetical protein EUTSA_v10005217mg [Eutrema salsugineum]|uniref:Uncharacterized protein n=1 Tax=Eutrema salsugineum TaxID=72664 RepID=V4K0K3_EUTSA|nr:hypothetical protein EUTSA_v10005217mg [Eutrema salsugineum]